ncbi:MAG: RAMP superfamily CRISPR-associated protein [Candidatus Nanopelagicales bacterium]
MINVTVAFHAPIRISTGTARDGIDASALADYVPGSSLKGAMRAAGRVRLGLPEPVLTRLFGDTGVASAWSWDDLAYGPESRLTTRVRIPVSIGGAASRGGMLVAEEVWVPADSTPSFSIHRQAPRGEVQPQDELLLGGCARAVKSLGAARRRGMGWVTMTPSVSGNVIDPCEVAAAIHAARRAVQ